MRRLDIAIGTEGCQLPLVSSFGSGGREGGTIEVSQCGQECKQSSVPEDSEAQAFIPTGLVVV